MKLRVFADWRRREYIRKRNILTSRSLSLKLPWASDYDVGGFSVRVFISMLHRSSHVLGQLVFGGAAGSRQPR